MLIRPSARSGKVERNREALDLIIKGTEFKDANWGLAVPPIEAADQPDLAKTIPGQIQRLAALLAARAVIEASDGRGEDATRTIRAGLQLARSFSIDGPHGGAVYGETLYNFSLGAAGYGQYEISNYARPGRECRHNLAYWLGSDYLGLGPSAFSTHGPHRWHKASFERLISLWETYYTKHGTTLQITRAKYAGKLTDKNQLDLLAYQWKPRHPTLKRKTASCSVRRVAGA